MTGLPEPTRASPRRLPSRPWEPAVHSWTSLPWPSPVNGSDRARGTFESKFSNHYEPESEREREKIKTTRERGANPPANQRTQRPRHVNGTFGSHQEERRAQATRLSGSPGAKMNWVAVEHSCASTSLRGDDPSLRGTISIP